MKKMLLLCFAILCMANTGEKGIEGKARIKDFYDIYLGALNQYGSYAQPPDLNQARKLKAIIRDKPAEGPPGLNHMLGQLDTDRILEEYLALMLLSTDVFLDTFLLSREIDASTHDASDRRFWHKTNDLSYLKSKLTKLRKIKSRRYQQEEVWSTFSSLPEKTLKSIRLYPLTEYAFQASVWPVFSTKLEESIREGEDYLWRLIVPDTTIRQLNHFINFAAVGNRITGYDGSYLYNHNVEEAYRLLYERTTQDGEPSTLQYFRQIMLNEDFQYTIWPKLFQGIARAYQHDQQLAVEAAGIVNRAGFASVSEYEWVVGHLPNKEIAYQAVVKIVQLEFIKKGSGSLVELAESYREDFAKAGALQNLNRLRAFVELLERWQNSGSYESSQLDAWNTGGHELERRSP